MNETIRTILARRSVRAYTAEPVSEQALACILQCAQYAPSARGAQSCRFVVLQQKAALERLAAMGRALKKTEDNPFYNAPVVILTFCKNDSAAPLCDGALALENIMLSAASLGLGTCWVNCVKGIFALEDGKAFQKEMGIADDYSIVASCALGHPAGVSAPAKPRKDDFVVRIR